MTYLEVSNLPAVFPGFGEGGGMPHIITVMCGYPPLVRTYVILRRCERPEAEMTDRKIVGSKHVRVESSRVESLGSVGSHGRDR